MRSFLHIFISIWAMIFSQLLSPYVGAQSVAEHVEVTPIPDWVIVQQIPPSETTLTPEGNRFFRLVDWQQRISGTINDRYRHNAIELKTADAVQDNSNFTISFDPSYQKIQIHKLELIRDEQKLNRLTLSNFDIYRTETDRDKRLYNGTLEASIIITDVQVGDILNYSYSVIGKNKALGPHYKATTRLKYSVPVQRQHERILIHEDIPLNIKVHGAPPEPRITKEGVYRSYRWLQNDLQDMDIEDNLPSWYYSQPTYEFSSFKDWEDVGEYFTAKYEFNHTSDPQISDIANMIESQTNDVKSRARRALDYVHDHIRYTGIEIGSGGYEPRPPTKTLAQKFGDCKDMTVLLLAILREMNIEAYPVLVSTDYRGGAEKQIPSYAAFDHVLVRTEIEGDIYLLDGTRGKQVGDLDRLEQSSYGKGLVLERGNSRFIDLELKQPAYYKDIQDTFDFLSDTESVKLENISNYYGYEADSMNSYFENNGRDAMEKNFLKFFQNTYPDITQNGDMEIKAFPVEGRFFVKVNYSLGKGWVENADEDYEEFVAYPSDVSSDTPDFKAGARQMPYALSHPRKSRHKLIFKLGESWPLEGDEIKIENEAFSFGKKITFKDGTYVQDYVYHSKQDHISADKFSKTMSDVKSLNDELGVELTNGTGWLESLSEESITNFIIFWAVMSGIILLIGAMLRRDFDQDWQEEQIYFPIKISKFIFLSMISIGLYSYFWMYKNWKWKRDVKGNPNIPFLRSWFMIFTNFAFLPSLSEDSGENQGYSWYSQGLGVVLALSYLFMQIIGRIANSSETAPIWLSLFGMVAFISLIPAVMQINHLNAGREDLIAKNSQYHWTTISFILLFIPILLLILFGLFS